ncbi:hypothetical protein PWT90_04184 [Aphanocladium album]|nr:hypothetical protein PWT90_04184 [Aphanocladium album]
MSDAANPVLDMMLSGEYSDLVFSCHGESFKVHRAVVCPQSSVIRAALTTGFKEAKDATLNMDAFQPATVRRFVNYLYTKAYDYDANGEITEDPNSPENGNQASPQANDIEANGDSTDNANARQTQTGDASMESDRPSTNEELPTTEQIAATENNAYNTIDPNMNAATAEEKPTTYRPEINDPVFKAILAHTRMNAMGDYYDIPELSKFANTQINTILTGASPDALWVIGLPVIAETALEIVNNEGLTEVLTAAISENLGTILAAGALEDSSLMTPFCLELLKKCIVTNQQISETLSYKIMTLNEVNTKYQKAADLTLQQRKAASNLTTTKKCRNTSCQGHFDCYFAEDGGTLRCRLCHAKH